MDQCTAEAEFLFHAAGELARRASEKRPEPGGLGQGLDAARPFATILPEQPSEEVEVFGHRERRIEVSSQTLGHIGDTRAECAPMARIGHIAAEHLNLPRLDRAGARDQRQQARLADPVRADQPGHAGRREIEADLVERTHLAVAQGHIPQAGNRCGSTHAILDLCMYVPAHCGSLVCSSGGQSTRGSSRT